MGAPELLPAGRVGRPHGLAGAFHVTRPRTRLLAAAAELTVAGQRRAVARRGGTAERPVLVLEGTSTREQAEALRGEDLLVDRQAAPPLQEDEWYAEDLVGCRVHDGDAPIGVVTALLPYPSCDLLEARRDDGSSILIPLIADAVRSVDVTARTIDADARFLGLEDAGGAA